MPNILLLETATPVCSVAIAENDKVVASRICAEPNAHSSKLAVFVDELAKEWGRGLSSLDAVCVSSGPGSYTGLRIGVSTAKGLCYALDKPLIAVETLQGMANLFLRQNKGFDGFVCPMIDARRMEVYTAVFDREGNRMEPTTAEVIDVESFGGYLAKGDVAFVGDGAEKTREILGCHPNAVYGRPFDFSCEGLLDDALRRYENQEFEDVAYFEPFYLKDFVAKKPVVKFGPRS
ncbi:MAG: tRNA (adenosine(37)-N6)-threonylcarbamoyltransferase complex dimerization subunit type 1 TsaB [Bacteroidales bacterium]|nr:tRNA (adenosine(37)-N6)-threonylcarbamoyltransferase complex dimerization subunit type 1 TsaB [Bacteroidales bacterium]